MIAPIRSALSSDLGLAARTPVTARHWTLTLSLASAAPARPAPRPAPRRLAADLDGLLTDGAQIRALAPALYASLAFTAGDGFLPGQIIDRSI